MKKLTVEFIEQMIHERHAAQIKVRQITDMLFSGGVALRDSPQGTSWERFKPAKAKKEKLK